MMVCKYIQRFHNDKTYRCMAYSKSERKDGLFWAHFPICCDENCPLKNPDLLEGAVLYNETLDA